MQTIRAYREAIRQAGQDGLSLRLRLFGFLFLFLNAIMLGVLVMLFATGVFQTGFREHRSLLQNELSHLSQAVYQNYGEISVRCVALAESLSSSLERRCREQGIRPSYLQNSPQLLEELLSGELSSLTGALEKAKSSGVFLVLDATVNPDLPDARFSRACLYLKNMEPNIVSGLDANLRYLIGPMKIARGRGIQTLPQWRMEMDISSAPYFSGTVGTARQEKLPTSRLYFWSPATVLPGGSERAMLCSAPLIASDGTVMGVCGFEVSEMLFKLAYAPDSDSYEQLFCMLSPEKEGQFHVSGALFAGRSATRPFAPDNGFLMIGQDPSAFSSYRQPEGELYAGLHQEIMLYPKDSAYQGERWALALMMPRRVLAQHVSARTHALLLWLFLLMGLDILLSFVISRRYIRPVLAALESLKQPDLASASKTRIPEIDDLLEFLQAQDERGAPPPQQESAPLLRSSLYQEFAKNIGTLSAAERSVFDLYMKGYTAREIADVLCLSINTIKTHNRRIYSKLNVTSRKELMIYIQMMGEAKADI